MTSRAPSRFGALLQETISHAMLFGVVAASGLGFGGSLLLLVADLLLVIVLSMPMHRAHGWRRTLVGLVLTVGLLAVLVAMCGFAYGIAILGDNLRLDAALVARFAAFERDTLLWMVALSALHLLALLAYAWTQPDPRKAWERSTAIASGATFLSLFLLAFVIAFLGEAVIGAARWLPRDLGPDVVLIALMIGLRYALACLLLLLPESVWEAKSRVPRKS